MQRRLFQKGKYPLWSPFVVELTATHEHKTPQTLKGYTRWQADNFVGRLGYCQSSFALMVSASTFSQTKVTRESRFTSMLSAVSASLKSGSSPTSYWLRTSGSPRQIYG